MRPPAHRRTFAFACVASTMLLAACGSGGGSDGAAGQEVTSTNATVTDPDVRPDLEVDDQATNGGLPAVTVRDVTNDEWIQFANLLPADKPLLVWFWAPH